MDHQGAKKDFVNLLTEARQVSMDLERGQASQPATDHFAQLQQAWQSTPLTTAVLGLDQPSRAGVLNWILTAEASALTVDIPEDVGLVELTLQHGEYSIQLGECDRIQCPDFSALIAALRDREALLSGDDRSLVDPLLLRVNLPSGGPKTKLLIPGCPEILELNAQVRERLTNQCQLLVLAGRPDSNCGAAPWKRVHEIARAVDVVLPVITSSEHDSANAQWLGSLGEPQSASLLPAVMLSGSADPCLPPFLASDTDPLREALISAEVSGALASGIAMLEDRVRHELRRLRSRRNQIQRRGRSTRQATSADDLRRQLDGIRVEIQQRCKTLLDEIAEVNRQDVLQGGSTYENFRSLIRELDTSAVGRHKIDAGVQLRLEESKRRDIEEIFRNTARKRIGVDMTVLREGLQRLHDDVTPKIRPLANAKSVFGPRIPEGQHLERALEVIPTIGSRYRGELRTRGFLQLIGGARQLVWSLVLPLTMLGLREVRVVEPYVNYGIGVLFLCGIVYAVTTRKKQDKLQLARELERLREVLSADLDRLLSETIRDKMVRIKDMVDSYQREWNQILDDIGRSVGSARTLAMDEEKSSLQSRSKLADERSRRLEALQRRVLELGRSASELEAQCDNRLKRMRAEVAKFQ